MLLQSISQNLAETVVVKDTQSLTKVKGVDPVTSSHCARVVPPVVKVVSIGMVMVVVFGSCAEGWLVDYLVVEEEGKK